MKIDGYVLYEPIGFGGSGPMWRAIDSAGQEFLLKLLGDDLRPELEHRINKLRAIQSPQVMRIHDLRQTTDGRYVILAQLLPGSDLELLRGVSHWNETQLNFIAWGIVSGLAALHQENLAHGDVSTGNVMLSQGQIVLVDLLGDKQLLTPEYAAPERGADLSSPAADIYAWGRVMQTLGWFHPLVTQALNPDASQRPSAPELLEQLAELPKQALPEIDESDLVLARMRASGRDVKTTAVNRESGAASLLPTRKPPVSDYFASASPNRVVSWQTRLLHWGIPALSGAAVALGMVLVIPGVHAGSTVSSAVASSRQEMPLSPAVPSQTQPPKTSQSKDSAKTKSPASADEPFPAKLGGSNPVNQADQAATASVPTDLLPADSLNPRHLKITDEAQAQQVLSTLLELRDSALMSQDAAALAKLSQDKSLIQASDQELIQRLKTSEAKIEGLHTQVKQVELLQTEDKQVRIAAVLSQGGYTQIDSIGNRHQVEAIPDTTMEIQLGGDPWVISGIVRRTAGS